MTSCFLEHFVDGGAGGEKRIVERLAHEDAALDVEHADFALGGVEDDRAVAGRARRVVERAQQSRFGRHVFHDVRLVPGVIAERDDGDTGAEQADGDFGGDAATAGGVFAVDDGEIDLEPLAQGRELFDDRLAPGFAKDVSQKQNAQRFRRDWFLHHEKSEACGKSLSVKPRTHEEAANRSVAAGGGGVGAADFRRGPDVLRGGAAAATGWPPPPVSATPDGPRPAMIAVRLRAGTALGGARAICRHPDGRRIFVEPWNRCTATAPQPGESLLRLPAAESDPPRVEITNWSAEPERVRQTISLLGTRPPARYWREASELPPSSDPTGRPLEGVKVALDPGHIGGAWARMEQRWYQPPNEATAVMEGEMTLLTAQLLKPILEAMGAQVSLVRDTSDPVTAMRPDDYASLAPKPEQAELYFYRKAEIRARADRVNQHLRPDLVVCLHFNAEPWGEPGKVTFVETNHLHLIVNGHYDAAELALDDVRYEMLERVFQRSEREELRLADAVATSLAAATGLPPYDYGAGHMAGNAHRPLPNNPYVWARNLMANRLYQCPVVFTEPYVMNNREVYDRVAAGDYAGERLVAGRMRKSLYREYAEGVAAGLKAHYRRQSSPVTRRTPAESAMGFNGHS